MIFVDKKDVFLLVELTQNHVNQAPYDSDSDGHNAIGRYDSLCIALRIPDCQLSRMTAGAATCCCDEALTLQDQYQIIFVSQNVS